MLLGSYNIFLQKKFLKYLCVIVLDFLVEIYLTIDYT